MSQLRCPYCRKTYGAELAACCPHCGRIAVIPPALRKTTFRERQRMREKVARKADHQRRQLFSSETRFGRSPMMLGLTMLGLVVLGASLIGRANQKLPQVGQRITYEAKTSRELEALRIALQRFQADIGRYPSPEEGLKALVLNPGNPEWTRPYVNVIKPDPWRTPYRYDLAPEGPQLRSAGPDKTLYTADDITEP